MSSFSKVFQAFKHLLCVIWSLFYVIFNIFGINSLCLPKFLHPSICLSICQQPGIWLLSFSSCRENWTTYKEIFHLFLENIIMNGLRNNLPNNVYFQNVFAQSKHLPLLFHGSSQSVLRNNAFYNRMNLECSLLA